MRSAAGDCAGVEGRCYDRGRERPLSACGATGAAGTVSHPAAGVPANSASDAGFVAKEYFAARPQHLPILWRTFVLERVDAGPRGAAFARRRVQLGKSGGLLSSLQPHRSEEHTSELQSLAY